MYCGSEASSKDMNLLFSSTFKHPEGELQKSRVVEDSGVYHHLHNRHLQQQQQQQLNSSLMRYRSAPSSLLANFVDGGGGGEGQVCEDFLHPRSSIPEAESIFARFMSCGGNGNSASPDLNEIEEKSPVAATSAAVNQRNSQFMASMEHEAREVVQQQNGYSPASQMLYQTPPPPPLQNNNSTAAMESPYRVVNSMVMDHTPQVKTSNGNCSNLIRHSSSPAGLFSNLTVDNGGFAVLRGMGNFRAANGTNGEASPSTSRLKGQINFSSGTPSSGLMSQISEIGSESIGASSPENGSLGSGNGGNRCYIPGFPIGSWDDSENFTGLKRVRDNDGKMFSALNASETQNGEAGNRTPCLTHHFSLPKTSAEMAAMEKFIQFQDSVPCKIRAKRGCATHPRSIAERVRRTRISERMRKLQELVPNMDKQTNTADMLDLAVEYIKDLQKHVETLTVNRTNCTCSSKQKPNSNPRV